MSNVFFIGDLHFGHKNICKFRPKWSTELEHRETLIENWNSVVKSSKDVVYVLGDAAFSREGLHCFHPFSMTGRKILVRGNHDELPSIEYLAIFEHILGIYKYKKQYWLTHAPIHPMELRGRINIHGHSHRVCMPEAVDGHYVNVCAEWINYTPIAYEDIRDGNYVRGRLTNGQHS